MFLYKAVSHTILWALCWKSRIKSQIMPFKLYPLVL
ncbi:rCG55199 [Rattus norvegicus]|uniref:RCG55199 n=1 Tax=Rattus norvegicus TaxID=10116 RepID=A6J831_RAT|nr:rCG55199 [Rattus norvegicus]